MSKKKSSEFRHRYDFIISKPMATVSVLTWACPRVLTPAASAALDWALPLAPSAQGVVLPRPSSWRRSC